MNNLSPFSARFTPEVPEILYRLHCTIAISTYQAGKVIFVSANQPEKLIQIARTFEGAMGIATRDNKLAVACKNETVVLANTPAMAKTYPQKPNVYDAIFLPRATYYTGQTALHDMNWLGSDLMAINTLFSSISKINADFSFTPVWQPPFISSLEPEDRCHLNGMAVENEVIKYATALGLTNTFHGWRENKLNGGILIHVPTNEIILKDLAMPHSPRIYDGKLYLLLSAAGELVEVDINNGTYKTLKNFNLFVRGMAKHGDYLFIGHSKLRHNISAFKDLPIAKKSQRAGVIIFHLPSTSIVGNIVYENSVDEIYDVKIIRGTARPNILNSQHQANKMGVVTPTDSFWAIKENKE